MPRPPALRTPSRLPQRACALASTHRSGPPISEPATFIFKRLDQAAAPWHFLYFFPEPQGHGSFRPIGFSDVTGAALPAPSPRFVWSRETSVGCTPRPTPATAGAAAPAPTGVATRAPPIAAAIASRGASARSA